MKFAYPFVWLVKKSRALSALSMRLVKLTGKSRYAIHPKHLIKIEKPWYLSQIKSKDFVLDLGCNNGQHSLKLAAKCRQVVGVDQDQSQLDIATASAKDKHVTNTRFIRTDLEKKLSFKSNTFSKVIFLDVLEHIVRRQAILKEVKRILKPDGLVFLAVPNSNTSWKKLQRSVGMHHYADPDHKIEYTLKEIKKEVESAGFEIVSVKPVTFDTPWVGFFDLLGGFSLNLYAEIARIKKRKARLNPEESTGFRIIMRPKK